MLEIEGDDPFAIVVLHDVEDVIHPLSLRLYNRFVPESQLLQIPVFALEYPWYEFVGWTYADEFAKNHCKDMLLRERLGAFVPSAGVGTAMARSGLDRVAESERDLFPEGALTKTINSRCGCTVMDCGPRLRCCGSHRSIAASRKPRPPTLRRASTFQTR